MRDSSSWHMHTLEVPVSQNILWYLLVYDNADIVSCCSTTVVLKVVLCNDTCVMISMVW